ncbi:MAG: hypothetical protein LBG43_08065 [Treponema sp.]|nr:hypothetical protein [Treponema sp.]
MEEMLRNLEEALSAGRESGVLSDGTGARNADVRRTGRLWQATPAPGGHLPSISTATRLYSH